MAPIAELKAKFSAPDDLATKIPLDEVRRFMCQCLVTAGASESNAEKHVEAMVTADSRGVFSHGLNRLEMYVNEMQSGMCDGKAEPSIEKESPSTALVNGNNGLGPVCGIFAMDIAIKKAKETGIAMVTCKGSNHFSSAGFYALRALEHGLIGMAFTNCSPLVAPTRASKRVLGTNPISCAAPGVDGDSFVLDMATSTAPQGKVEMQVRKKEPLPVGWAINQAGEMTTNAEEGAVGALLPLGGAELTSGYKGYGLAMMVEMFCATLSGAQYGLNLRPWLDTSKIADLGHAFIAIDPNFFAGGFEARMSGLIDMCRDLKPNDPAKPVLVPGDPEKSKSDQVKKEGAITYIPAQMKDSYCLGKALGVTPMNC